MSINISEKIKTCFFLLRCTLKKDTWQLINPCDVLLVRHDNNCGYKYCGKVYAQLIDSFGELCNRRNLKVSSVATFGSKFIGNLAYYSPVSYDKSFVTIAIIGKVVKILRGRDFGIKWGESHYKNLWCEILEKAAPKIVIGIQPDKHLIQAGKLKKIPVYDLQHGIITDEDPYYGEVYRRDNPITNLPDGFLCWDEQSIVTILKWAKNKGIPIIKVGNPWFLRFVTIHPDDLLVNKAIAREKIIGDDRPCIMVTLQWGLAKYYVEREFNGVMVEVLEKVILDTIDTYHWILRLHPIQMIGSERKRVLNYLKTTFGDENVRRWLIESEIPLPLVLSVADLHITDHSAVVVEAAWMGIRSGLLGKELGSGKKYESWFSHERSIGMAEVLPQNPDIIKQWIVTTLAKGPAKPTLKDSSQVLDTFIDNIVTRCNHDR